MQNRFVAAGIVCLMVAGPVYAQATQGDQRQDVQQATTPDQSSKDTSVGGMTDTRSQYGSPSARRCVYTSGPDCDIFFGN
jgi:hypothetical protein